MQKIVYMLCVMIIFGGVNVFPVEQDGKEETSAVLPDSDLYCWGHLIWDDVNPGSVVHGDIWVMNQGNSNLEWNITEWPDWGVWDFGSFFPCLPPGGCYIVFVNVTAPNQGNMTFIGTVWVVNTANASDFGIINTSLSTHEIIGYTVSEDLIGIIGWLHISENVTSFTIFIGQGTRSINYDDGSRDSFPVYYLLTPVGWDRNVLFLGFLRPHVIWGNVRYRGF